MTTETRQTDGAGVTTGKDTLTITDNRTGKQYEIPIEDETIRATELRQIKVHEDDFGLMSYDPAFMATASCRSAVTFIDGEKGILEYRGYPIDQLAERSNYLEVAYLLVHGELPSHQQLEEWVHQITIHTFVHENIKEFMQGFRYEPDPRLEHALDVLFILHADHEQNASTSAVRSVGSTQVDPYSAVAAGVAALYGPLHGGANEAALRMLRRIETKDNVPDFIKGVKDGKERLMGFGHRVYKNYDPRAKIIKRAVDEVLEVTGTNPLLDIALELEKIALEDDYFIDRKLYPNVDFYSGLIYEALGMPMEMFPVLFGIGRTSGWIAQWLEMIDDKEQKIARPRQIYTGSRGRDYVPIEQRS